MSSLPLVLNIVRAKLTRFADRSERSTHGFPGARTDLADRRTASTLIDHLPPRSKTES
jgi:hypothetical protein